MNFRDVEMLSAYLDGQLSPKDASRLESRLAADEGLVRVLDDLRSARGVLRQLPNRRAPRDFTLRPAMNKLAAPEPRLYPALRLATVLASVLFLASIAVNGLTPLAAPRFAAAPAPALGKGGGVAGRPAEGATPAPAEVPSAAAPLQSFAAAPSTPTAEVAVTSAASDLAASAAKAAPPRAAPPAPTGTSVPLVWVRLLAAAAIVFGLLAWYLRYLSKRKFRSRWIEK